MGSSSQTYLVFQNRKFEELLAAFSLSFSFLGALQFKVQLMFQNMYTTDKADLRMAFICDLNVHQLCRMLKH